MDQCLEVGLKEKIVVCLVVPINWTSWQNEKKQLEQKHKVEKQKLDEITAKKADKKTDLDTLTNDIQSHKVNINELDQQLMLLNQKN